MCVVCACYFSPLSSYVNVIRFLIVKRHSFSYVAFTTRHSCERALRHLQQRIMIIFSFVHLFIIYSYLQLLCNGFGDCTCGKCRCDKSSPFFGPTCEHCPVIHFLDHMILFVPRVGQVMTKWYYFLIRIWTQDRSRISRPILFLTWSKLT